MKIIPKDLPKGTPLVINAMVPAYCESKVLVVSYDRHNDAYSVETAEDHVDYTGWTTKKGKVFLIKRECLFGAGDIPDEWSEDLKRFVNAAPVPLPVSFTRYDIVQEALYALEVRLRRSKRAEDKEKLQYLLAEVDGILSKFRTT